MKSKMNQSVPTHTQQPTTSHTHFFNPQSTPVVQKVQEPFFNPHSENAFFKPASKAPIQAKATTNTPNTSPSSSVENKTGLPDNLKSGVENLSGMAMDDVKVHYNSDKPAQMDALAFAQGKDIHLASGQEQHLPHEAWHVVQQKQGRVQPTVQRKTGVNINDDAGLEQEADVMGNKALGSSAHNGAMQLKNASLQTQNLIQRKPADINKEYDLIYTFNYAKSTLFSGVKPGRNKITSVLEINGFKKFGWVLPKDPDMKGGHLLKREYGGEDDVTNVVPWQVPTEDEFTTFENDYFDTWLLEKGKKKGKLSQIKVKFNTAATFTNKEALKMTEEDAKTWPELRKDDLKERIEKYNIIAELFSHIPDSIAVELTAEDGEKKRFDRQAAGISPLHIKNPAAVQPDYAPPSNFVRHSKEARNLTALDAFIKDANSPEYQSYAHACARHPNEWGIKISSQADVKHWKTGLMVKEDRGFDRPDDITHLHNQAQALIQHKDVEQIKGEYKSDVIYHYIAPDNLWVGTTLTGEFIAGYRISPQQRNALETKGTF